MSQKVNKKKRGRPPTPPGELAPSRWMIEGEFGISSGYETSHFSCARIADELELTEREVEELLKNGEDDADW